MSFRFKILLKVLFEYKERYLNSLEQVMFAHSEEGVAHFDNHPFARTEYVQLAALALMQEHMEIINELQKAIATINPNYFYGE